MSRLAIADDVVGTLLITIPSDDRLGICAHVRHQTNRMDPSSFVRTEIRILQRPDRTFMTPYRSKVTNAILV